MRKKESRDEGENKEKGKKHENWENVERQVSGRNRRKKMSPLVMRPTSQSNT